MAAHTTAVSSSIAADIEQYAIASSVPMLITIEPQDVASAVVPPPLFLMMPRSCLMVGAWAPLSKHLRPFVASLKDDELPLWLELRNTDQCVPWHYPVGALADAMFANEITLPSLLGPSTTNDSGDENNGGRAPQSWCSAPLPLIVHVGEARRDKKSKSQYTWRVRCEKDCQTIVQQSVKASLATMYDDTRAFFKLSPKPTMALINATLTTSELNAQQAHRDVTAAWSEMSKTAGVDPIAWPCFAHVVQIIPPSEAAMMAAAQRGVAPDTVLPIVGPLRVIPLAIKTNKKGLPLTFADLLRESLPDDILKASGLDSVGSDSENNSSNHDRNTAGVFRHRNVRVIVNGTEPLLETPLNWLITNFKAADGALHFVIVHIKEE